MSDVDEPWGRDCQEGEPEGSRSGHTPAPRDAGQSGDRSTADSAVGADGLLLIDKMLRGELDDDEGRVLAKLLKETPELRAEYRGQVDVHSALLWRHGRASVFNQSVDPIAVAILINEAEQAARAQALQDARDMAAESCLPEAPCAEDLPAPAFRWRDMAGFAAGAAAAALLLLVFALTSPHQPPPVAQEAHVKDPLPVPPPVVARLKNSRDAVWEKITLQTGNAVDSPPMPVSPGAVFREQDRYYLHSGFASLTTLAGAVVSVESPSEIEFVGANHIRLLEGKVLGECATSESRGFVVDTPTRRIVDLGTEFGVWQRTNGSLFTEVFEGKVVTSEFASQGAKARTRELVQNQALAIDQRGVEAPAERSLDSSPFNQLTAARMGVTEMTDGIVFLSRPPKVITNGALSSEKGLFVIEELRTGFTLPADLNLTLQGAGEYEDRFRPGVDSASVNAGTVIRSYIIHVDCSSEDTQVRRGKLTFDGDILGVIANPQQWNDFVMMAPEKTCSIELELNETTLLEDHSNRRNVTLRDSIRLAEDGRTIEFSLCVSGRAFDAFRVIVDQPE